MVMMMMMMITHSPGAAAPGMSCSICSPHTGKGEVQPIELGRLLVFEEVHLMMMKTTTKDLTFKAKVRNKDSDIYLEICNDQGQGQHPRR